MSQAPRPGSPSTSTRVTASDGAVGPGEDEPSSARIGIDIGGTSVRATLFDADDAVLRTERAGTPDAADRLVPCCVELVHRLVSPDGPMAGATIGVGVPGRVRPETGEVFDAVNLGIDSHGLDLATNLATALNGPVDTARNGPVGTTPVARDPSAPPAGGGPAGRVRIHVENDVNAATLGCARLLHHPADQVLAYVSVGTGLSAGILVGTRLLRGSTGLAGEIGHLPVDPSGPACPCGQTGCLEVVASGGALSRHWPPDVPGHTAADLARAAADGHPAAHGLWHRATSALAWAVQLLALTVEPDVVVLGGGVAEAGQLLIDALAEHLRRRAEEAPLLTPAHLDRRLRLVPAQHQLGGLGALLAAEESVPGRALAGGRGPGERP